MKARHRDGAWLLGILVLAAGAVGLHHASTQRPGSQDPQTRLTIDGVRPGDSKAEIRTCIGEPPGQDPLTWRYAAATLRFAGPNGPLQAIVGTQLEERLGLVPQNVYKARPEQFLAYANESLDMLDSLFAPHTDIQSATNGRQSHDWLIYPRFHLRIDCFPNSSTGAYYTLATDNAVLADIHWQGDKLPALDTWNAAGIPDQ